MSHAVLSRCHWLKPQAVSRAGLPVALGLAVWLALVYSLALGEVFVTPGDAPPLALLFAVTSPVMVFLAGYGLFRTFREFVLAADPRLMTAIQAWRIGGFSFLALYAYGILPGYFAWPAGIGDMAIGVTAPWIALLLLRQRSFLASKSFVAWNLFGILDLVVAVGMGAFGPLFFAHDLLGAGATRAMAYLPLVLVPAFFVPVFIILHLGALFQARRISEEKGS